MSKIYNHNTTDVWKAIGIDGDSVTKRLVKLSLDCTSNRRKPSEKIENMSKVFTKDELSAIVVMMEFKIRNMEHTKNSEIAKSYM